MFEKILGKIREYDTIIIHRHTNPDGDAIGSQYGMYHLIKDNFPDKTVYLVGDPAGRYSFIQDRPLDEIDDEVYGRALAIVLDTASGHLISDPRYTAAKESARFDHHIFCEKICDVEAVDTSYESCCGLLTEFALSCGLKIGKDAARSLFTGMVTDSGRFRYDSTTSNTFRLASELMKVGVDTVEIYRNLYQDDFEKIKQRAAFTLKVNFAADNVAYIYTTKEEVKECGLDPFSISRGMVGVMSEIRGVDIWVNFTECESGVLAELRSNRYNINPVAVKYGGGGHAKASGATVKDRDTAMSMLEDLKNIKEVK